MIHFLKISSQNFVSESNVICFYYLKSLDKPFNMFWVTEFTNYNYNTHNHLLLKGDIAGDINSHLKSQSLIGDHVKHLPYEKSASIYVSQFICDDEINYNMIKKS